MKLFLLIFLILIIKISYNLITQQIEKQKLLSLGISNIDSLDGKTFEKYLEALFSKAGYKVKRTSYIGDYGADLIIESNGKKTVIQAKRWRGKVGVKAIQEALAAKGYYRCHEAVVITNSYYTQQAYKLAKANNIELWNRKQLIKAFTALKD